MKGNLRFTSRVGKVFYPSLLWKIADSPKTIYLTFDDGPIPKITPWVLSLLKDFNAKATFFCIGDNIKKHPDVFDAVCAQGHAIGNHTFHHLKGWKTSVGEYVENIKLTEHTILNQSQKLNKEKSNRGLLFRPPYGKINRSQIKQVQRLGYRIVMWDIISMDFDSKIPARESLDHIKKYASGGSIIVFHDSIKAFQNLQEILPQVLEYYTNKGFRFESL